MSDTTITLSPHQAMQVQAALGDRVTSLIETAARMTPGSFEATVVDGALRAATDALAVTVKALYPASEAEVDAEWQKAKDEMDRLQAADLAELAAGDHYAGMVDLPSSSVLVASVQVYEGMEGY